tara:strand:- start:269 stop:547 length:279 start_codon:yes stop_codon:yes gene_type:complete
MPKRNDYFMKIFLLTLVFTLSFFTSGCKIFPGFKKYISSDINVAGALTHSPNSFSPVEAGTIRLQSEEVWYRRDFSGNKTTFLWGLFTFTDY